MANLKANYNNDAGEATHPAIESRGLAQFLEQQGFAVPPELLQAFAQQNKSYSTTTPPQGREGENTEEVDRAETD